MFKWSFLLWALLFAMPRQAWSQTLGETAARLPDGESSSALSAVVGVRMWF